MGQKFHLNHSSTISEINTFFASYIEIQDGREKWRENNFWETVAGVRLNPWGPKICRHRSISHSCQDKHVFEFYAEIQYGLQKWRENHFGQKITGDALTLHMPCGPKILLKLLYLGTVSEINTFLHFTQKFKMATKHGRKMIFGKQLQNSVYTLWVKNFVRIVLSHTVSKIHKFLHFTQNFKMASENGGKTIIGK